MQYDQCLTKGPDGSKVMITHCNLNEFKEWQYFKVRCAPAPGRVYAAPSEGSNESLVGFRWLKRPNVHARDLDFLR